MNETIQITLDSQLVRELKQATAQNGASLDNVFADFAQKYLDEAREEKIRLEFEAYVNLHGELTREYLEQHVAIHERHVIDHDVDAMQLVRRVRAQYGNIPILFVQVHAEAIPEFVIHSTHIVDSQ